MMANDEAAAKLRTFAFVLKFGNDLMNAANFDEAAARAVNDSRPLLDFRSAALFEVSGRKAELAAQSGIPEKNPRAKVALQQQELLQKLSWDDESFMVLDRENGLPDELAGDGLKYFICKLPRPASVPEKAPEFILLLEYEREIPAFVENMVKIAGNSIAGALYFHLAAGKKGFPVRRRRGKRIFWLLVLLLVFGLMFIRVPESTTAEFTLQPEVVMPVYARFDGSIVECLKEDGSQVVEGEIIARYDTAIFQYRCRQAQSELAELEAEIALEERNAFTDAEKMGKVQLLYARRRSLEIAIAEAQWFLDNSEIRAPVSGVLVLQGGRAGSVTGRSVRTGDIIFEIYSGSCIIAEIPVNETDSSILQNNDLAVELFLHTAPQEEIPAEVVEIAAYPELTGQKRYCYMVRAQLPDTGNGLKYGMRGIAKLYSGEVTLGYRLFKSALLYFRGL